MKKTFLILVMLASIAIINAQGWVGNSGNNSIVPYNSNLQFSPLNVGIGVSAPSEQLHTNSGVRFEGLQQLDNPTRVVVQDNTGKLYWRPLSLFGQGNNWSLTGNNNATNPGVAANQNYLGTNTNHRVIFATGGVNSVGNLTGAIERMTILNTSGQVGIGTSAPTSLLTVGNGTTGIGNQANQGYLFKSMGSVDSNVEHTGFFNNDKATSRTEVTISNSGNGRWEDNFIGIMVHGNSFTHSGRNDYYLNQNNSGYALINAQSNANDSTFLKKFSIGVRTPNVPMSFYTNNTERIFITSAGNIGIGTTAPQKRLEITDGTAGNSGLRFTNLTSGTDATTNNANQVLSVTSQGDVVLVSAANGGITNSCQTANTNLLTKYNGTNSLTCSQIFDNGTSVSIGGHNPAASLDVKRGAAGTTAFRVRGTGWHSDFNSGTNEHTYIRGGIAGTSNVYIKDYTGGGVGVGHQPVNFGYTSGTRLGAPASGTATMSVNGITTASGFAATSDETVKTAIEPISNAIEIINKLNGKSYAWTEEFRKEASLDNGRHIGFLAQELEKVIPEAVIKFKEGRYAVDYNSIIPVLSEAIKELNAKVEKQNNAVIENEALKTKIASLEERQASYDEKFALLEKTIAQLCESGCVGLEKKTDVDALYQSIPNPTDSEALINYYLSREYSDASISIYTQDGKAMKTIQLEGKKGNGSIKINLSDLSNGTYIYTLVAGERIIDSKKLQIVK